LNARFALAVIAAFAAGSSLAATAPRSSAAPPGAIPDGRWQTFANGDDVLALVRAGTTLWAGTRAGGLVRWDTAGGSTDQFLRPQDPLAGNTVTDIARGPDGRLWLATEAGLTMFDDRGTRDRGDDEWRSYNHENTFGGLPSDDVRAVVVDGDRIWVGTAQVLDPATGAWSGGGLARLDQRGTPQTHDDTWAPAMTFDATRKRDPSSGEQLGLVSDTINDLALTADGNLWVAAGPHWSLQPQADREAPPSWQRIHGGLSFLDTRRTVDTADDGWTATSCATMQFTVTCNVQALAVDGQGYLWAAVGGRGVMYLPANRPQIVDDRTQIFEIPDRQGGESVLAIAFGPAEDPALAHTVWLARSKGGLSVLNHRGTLRQRQDDEWNFGRPQAFGMADGLARDRIQALSVQADGVWIGGGPQFGLAGGLNHLNLADLVVDRHLVTSAGPPSNFISDLDFGAAGTRWAGHVWLATGSRKQRLFGAGAVDLDTRGTAAAGDDRWTRYTTRSTDLDGEAPWTGLAGDNVHAVAVQGERVWLGSQTTTWDADARRYRDGGLAVFDGTTWTARTVESTAAGGRVGLRDNGVSSLAVGCNGELWIGTGNPWDYRGAGVDVLRPGSSVHILHQDAWTAYSFPQLASDNTTAVAPDCARGRVWVAALHHVSQPDLGSPGGRLVGGGVALHDLAAGSWTRFDTRNGLESYADRDALRAEAITVAVDGDGRGLVGTYGTKDMGDKALVAQRPFWPAVLNAGDSRGWSHRVFERAGWVSSIALDGDGRIWLGTSRGGAAREDSEPESWRLDARTGGLWVSDGTSWELLDVATAGLPANDIAAVAVAPDGDIWIGTEGWGLARFQPGGEAPTPTPTADAPSPTPSPTSPAEATPTSPPTSTAFPATPVPDRGRTLFLPSVSQRAVRGADEPAPTRPPPGPTSPRTLDHPTYLPVALKARARG
jgi:ligand-binding sensor domain-containing protein